MSLFLNESQIKQLIYYTKSTFYVILFFNDIIRSWHVRKKIKLFYKAWC